MNLLSRLLNTYNVRKYDIINSDTSKGDNNILNNFPIYVINLKEDKTRRNYIKFLFKKYKINYFLIIVNKFKYTSIENQSRLPISEPVLGCILSHLWCIKNAIYKYKSRFIIFEDDILFHKNFDNLFKQIMETHVDDIDLLMLGALDMSLNTNLQNVHENDIIYYPTTNILGAHANMYTLNFAKHFLEYKLNTDKIQEFDYDYIHFFDKFKIGICIPNLVVCELSTTNLRHVFSPLNVTRYEIYKKWFPENFTYNDYEYIIMIFIIYIKEQIDMGNTFNSLQEMTDKFVIKQKHRNRNISYVCSSILNSGYTIEDVLNIVSYISLDKY